MNIYSDEKKEICVQTEPIDMEIPIDEKLALIDLKHGIKKHQMVDFNDELTKIRRELEIEYSKKFKNEIERFKMFETIDIIRDLNNEHQTELSNVKNELTTFYESKVKDLKEQTIPKEHVEEDTLKLLQKLQAGKDIEKASLIKEIESLRITNSQLEVDLSRERSELAFKRKTNENLHVKIKAYEVEVGELNSVKEENVELERNVRKLTNVLNDKEKDMIEFQKIISSCKDRIRELESELTISKALENNEFGTLMKETHEKEIGEILHRNRILALENHAKEEQIAELKAKLAEIEK
eukprot:TRINITY_DN3281_c2_g1_i1.p2 TRINITY_DN3281_c2_g1~~TRINITY_DN3281_c2_g1_i1.p2  ORF type:complete len:296 (+),score=98.50 TRINITY_DN3281_c2_g1_i1:166-1053(+)